MGNIRRLVIKCQKMSSLRFYAITSKRWKAFPGTLYITKFGPFTIQSDIDIFLSEALVNTYLWIVVSIHCITDLDNQILIREWLNSYALASRLIRSHISCREVRHFNMVSMRLTCGYQDVFIAPSDAARFRVLQIKSSYFLGSWNPETGFYY